VRQVDGGVTESLIMERPNTDSVLQAQKKQHNGKVGKDAKANSGGGSVVQTHARRTPIAEKKRKGCTGAAGQSVINL